jgi:hypothetical protein
MTARWKMSSVIFSSLFLISVALFYQKGRAGKGCVGASGVVAFARKARPQLAFLFQLKLEVPARRFDEVH